ncbi:DUF4142 domain-containing protein (plasmid) [Roseomonas sp. OT10]|uniref:DUF4142 domain-containing protein n=1 Tax=Roseomonas cutis TaxID=2897332 RepID=UPI001E463821|nr:DUF4142 domain-containing protein [Roseomonas sp. OT10]UFN51628.1 DUF4142 domain-containing protein [Roseomonas sp. OT10]
MTQGTARRALLLAVAAAPLPAAAQDAAAGARPVEPGRFLAFAHSSAVLQQRAAALAAAKDTRPEVKAFAAGMARFRPQQLDRLRAVARERNLALPTEEEFEHRVVLENLEPLDHLALSRRYAEVQVQALTQEIRGYEAAAQGPDDGLRRLAAEMLPQLRPWRDSALRMQDGVKP